MNPSRLWVALFFAPLVALAQVPAKLGYQGRLLDSNGAPIEGPLSITFAIHAAEAGTDAPLWKEVQSLALTNGYYATFLGAVTPLPADLFNGSDRFLQLSVGDSVLSPRQRIASVAFALVAQGVSGGPVNASSLAVANKTVIDGSGRLAPEALGVATLSQDKLHRGGLMTDVARGASVSITAGTIVGGGPTNEFAVGSWWQTSTFPSTLTIDLGASYAQVEQIVFESAWRGDVRFIPTYSGAAAYALDYSNDGSTWTNVPPVAPVEGDVFIHKISRADMRYLRLKIVAPVTAGNAVHISMLRALSYIHGDSARIDARRLYGLNGAPAGRVTGNVQVACKGGSLIVESCKVWGSGSCSGSTKVCGQSIGCGSTAQLVNTSHALCWTPTYGTESYCYFYLCIE